jgi:hypothetical protein
VPDAFRNTIFEKILHIAELANMSSVKRGQYKKSLINYSDMETLVMENTTLVKENSMLKNEVAMLTKELAELRKKLGIKPVPVKARNGARVSSK